jgi:hypothetical protein
MQGSIAEIEEGLPSGFHDAELFSVEVDWKAERLTFRGAVDVSKGDPPEEYRPFVLVVDGLRALLLPLALVSGDEASPFTVSLDGRGWCGGLQGWPPDREPARPPFPQAWVYSFFLHELNDFITVQGMAARLEWAGAQQVR